MRDVTSLVPGTGVRSETVQSDREKQCLVAEIREWERSLEKRQFSVRGKHLQKISF